MPYKLLLGLNWILRLSRNDLGNGFKLRGKKSREVCNSIAKFNPFAITWFGYLLSIENKGIKWLLWQMHSDTMLQIYFGYNGRGPKTPSCGKTMV